MTEENNTIQVQVPSEWTSDENFKGFFKDNSFDLGGFGKAFVETRSSLPVVPEKPDAYTFEFPQDFPFDEADIKLQREMAHGQKLTQAQYEAIVKYDLSRATRAAEETANEIKAVETALRKDWGGKFEDNLKMAKAAADKVFGKGFSDRLDIGNDPVMIKGLYLIASKLGEDFFKAGGETHNERPVGSDGKPRLKFKSMGE